MLRQGLLTRENPARDHRHRRRAILRRQIGGPRRPGFSLNRLIELANQPNIDIRVVPFSAGAHAGLDGQVPQS